MDPFANLSWPPRPWSALRRVALPPLLLALLATGCLPTTGGVPQVALLNAPRSVSLDDLAGVVLAALQRVAPEPRGYGFVSRSSLAFLESRSAIDDNDAAENAARVARNRGGTVAVMIGAPQIEREIDRDKADEPRQVRARVTAEAVLVRASDGVVLDRVLGPALVGAREVAPGEGVPDEPRQDPTVIELARRSADALAPALDAALRRALVPGEVVAR